MLFKWFFGATLFLGIHCQDFGYDGNEGPSHWGEKYQKCVGKHQSPIDIEEHNVKVVKFPHLKFEHFNKHLEEVLVKNNGHTVQISVVKGKVPGIAGGPLKGHYTFAQMHFHWGPNDTEGSENMVNHKGFPMELHMVFYKTGYGTIEKALDYDDGLTVLSFLYAATEEDNKYYNLFEDGLVKVMELNSSRHMVDFVSLDKFTMKHRESYYTYEGSLTTPPCSEVVTWIEFKHTIPLAHQQIETFRQLSGPEGKLTHNFRPPQPIYDRVIRMNKSQGWTFEKPSLLVLTSLTILRLWWFN